MIPRTIHLIWMGDDPPAAYLSELKVLRRLNPDWTVQWWREPELAGLSLRNRDWFDNADELVPDDSVYQLRSDIARYEILHSYGGVYVDLDYRWQKPLSAALHDGDRMVTCWERQGTYVGNGFIAAVPEHPVLDRAVAQVPEWCRKWGRRGLRANRLTGPGGLWTALIKDDQRQTRSVRVLPARTLHPVPWSHPEWADVFTFPDAVGIHLFGHQRSLKGM